MTKRRYDDIDRFLEEAETISIPHEYIKSACITDIKGREYYVSFEELSEIVSAGSFESQGISHIQAIIDMNKVKENVIELSEQVLSAANL